SDQAGAAARDRRRRVRTRSTLRDHPGGVVQADRTTCLQDGAAAPSFRVDRLERAEGHHAVRDRVDHLCAVQFDDAEIEVMCGWWPLEFRAGMGPREY